MNKDLLIGDLSKKYNITTQSIRYYERIGLINPPVRNKSKYRVYSHEHEKRIRFILQAKQFGLTLDDIRQLIDLSVNNISPCGHLKSLLGIYIKDVDNRIEQLKDFKSQLSTLYRQIDSDVENEEGTICKIIESKPLK